MPKPLDLSRLAQFEEPKLSKAGDVTPAPQQPVEPWPSREPQSDGQISIKAPLDTIRRFKTMCKDDRRTYADMLRILMDAFENRNR